MNPKGCEMLGLSSFSEVEGRPLSDFIESACYPLVDKAFQKALSGEAVEFECDVRNTSGGFLASAHLFPLHNEEGEVVSLFGLTVDISQGEETLRHLRNSERRYRQMFETNLAVKFILHPKTGAILEANSAACRFYGYSAEELAEMSVFDINALSPEQIQEEMRSAVAEERLVFEFQHRLKNGEVRDVEVLSGPIDTEEGVRLYSIVFDVTDRKLAERELAKSEERLAFAIRGSDDGVWDEDLVTDRRYWSDRCKALLGYEPHEISANGREDFSFVHPDDRGMILEALDRHLEHGEPYDRELRLLHRDGTYRWFRTRGEATRDENGVAIRISGTLRDIHARYEVAEQLRRSEERFAFAVAGSMEGIWDWNIPSGEMWWSPRLKELLGYKESEISASRERLYALMHPDDEAHTREVADRTLEEGRIFDLDYRLKTKSGDYRWFRSRGQAVRDENGVAVRASGSISDIHEEVLAAEKEALRTHRLSMQRRCILELASDPVLGSGGVREACKRMTELACEVLNAGRCSVLLIEPGGVNMRSIDLFVAAKQEHFSGVVWEAGELPSFFGEVEKSRAIVSRNPIEDSRFDEFPRSYIHQRSVKSVMEIPVRRGGKLVGVIGITDTESHREWEEDEVDFGLNLAQQVARVLDQADAYEAEEKQRDLERQMLHAQKMESLGLMAGGIAHDFNNLLVAILGNANLLQNTLPIASKEHGFVEEIESASQRAAELCQQMLAYSGHSKHETSGFSLQGMVEEMIQLLHISVSKKAELDYDWGEVLPLVEGDPSQIRQVIMNLILNASESLVDGEGSIHLSIKEVPGGCPPGKHGINVPASGDYLCLTVKDTGCGMSAEILDRIYDPFYSTKFKGRGLGLASVLGIVRAHRGGIQVESTVGEGTVFRLCLPIAQDQSLPEVADVSRADDWKGTGLALMVDDDETVLLLGKEMLGRLGFQVIQATNGEEGLRLFEQHRHELVIVLLDLTMPGLSGERVYAGMQDLDASIPVVMSSGYTEQDVSLRLGSRGLRGFLQKPYTLDQMRGQIHQLLGRSS